MPYTSSSKIRCPKCGRDKKLVRYIDNDTGEIMPDIYGRCDRETECGYHKYPETLSNFSSYVVNVAHNKTVKKVIKHPSYISERIMVLSIRNYENNLFTGLLNHINYDNLNLLFKKYKIGTSKHWKNATVFWQIDKKGFIRTGKVMLYDSLTAKRMKTNGKSFTTWVHSLLKIKNFNLEQCLFGEHLLEIDKNSKPVAIVESEKTAVVCSHYFQDFTWLATGSLNGISEAKFRVLEGRDIILYPDVKCYAKWKKKMEILAKIIPFKSFKVSRVLENFASHESYNGLDLADFLKNEECNDQLRK